MRSAKLSLALLVASVAACVPITLLTADPTWPPLAIIMLASLTAIGVAARAVRLPHALAQAAQVVALAGWLIGLGLIWSPTHLAGAPMIDKLTALGQDGMHHIQTSYAPMSPHLGASWLLLALIGVVFLLADLLTISLDQAAWSIAPLSTPYLVPALGLSIEIPWWHFALLAVGYSAVLATQQVGRSSRGRYRIAALLVAPAVAGALLIGNALPTGNLADTLANWGHGRALELADPSINLADNLRRDANGIVLRYQTDAAGGLNLRLAALPVLTENGATLASVTVLTGTMPPPPGQVGGAPTNTQVRVADFSSEYLPAPYAPTSFAAPGEWGWDPDSLAILALGDNRKNASKDLDYSVRSLLNAPTHDRIVAASAGRPADAQHTAALPDGVPARITTLANEITRDATSAGAKALAIQAYLRDPARFSYSTKAPGGSGFGVLEQFLTTERTGYCIHFASAMALLSRVVGIPSRVAVGFLPGKKDADGWWTVTSHDMHAWPELYFDGLGWVAFEPTAGVAGAPSWSDAPTTTPSASPTPSASAVPTPSASTAPTTAPTATAAPTAAPSQTSTGIDTRWLAWAAGIAAGVALVLAPFWVRVALRWRRLSAAQDADRRIDNAWREVRASWLDWGGTWPDGTPRRVAAELGGELDAPAAAAITQLALLVERSRYAEHPADPGELASLVRASTAHLGDGASTWRRLAARLLPRSLWLTRSTTLDTPGRD